MSGRRPTQLDKGLDAFEQQRWRQARRQLEAALPEEPRAAGQYALGLMYWRGLGGPANKNAAVDCFARAATDSHAGAQAAYGIALRSGVGVAKDNDAARAQFRAAAGAGDCEAMVQLAAMSEPSEHRQWLKRAAELGYPKAMRLYADELMREHAVDALAWLYATVAVSGDQAARERAVALAHEMDAVEIVGAQSEGRAIAKRIKGGARPQR
jgi:TPR repeat protein